MSYRYFGRGQRCATCRFLKPFPVFLGGGQKGLVFRIVNDRVIEPSRKIQFIAEHPVLAIGLPKQAEPGIAPCSGKHLCGRDGPVGKLPFGAVMVLVKGPYGIHDDPPPKVQQRVELHIQGGKLYGYFLTAFLKLQLAQELEFFANGRGYEQGHPAHLELMPLGNPVRSQVLPICFHIAAHGNRDLSKAQKRTVVDCIHIEALFCCI